jgi:hypothetical protein
MRILPSILALTLLGSAAVAAPVGAILGQGDDGNVYRISTVDASVSLYQDLDPVGVNGISPSSPNGLGYNLFNKNTAFRTDFNDANTPNTLFRNNEALIEIPGGSTSVASGHVEGDTFFYIDRTGKFYSVSDIFDAAGSQVVSFLGAVSGSGLTFGDIAIWDDKVYVSTGDLFGVFDLIDPNAGFTKVVQPTQRYAGIAFDKGMLFGFTADGSDKTNQLFSISIAAATFGAATLIGDIVIDGVLLTDAAPVPVPLPPAALMLMGGLAGLAALSRRRSKEA